MKNKITRSPYERRRWLSGRNPLLDAIMAEKRQGAAIAFRIQRNYKRMDRDRFNEWIRSVALTYEAVGYLLEFESYDRRPNAASATNAKRSNGQDTRKRVIAMAQDMKRRNPALSKKRAAELIGKDPQAPCSADRARKYLDGCYNMERWKELGHTDR